jgi:hypothetical protein
MRDGAQIYYNADLNFTHYSHENFPLEWRPILLEGGEKITELENAKLRRENQQQEKKAVEIEEKSGMQEKAANGRHPERVFPKLYSSRKYNLF